MQPINLFSVSSLLLPLLANCASATLNNLPSYYSVFINTNSSKSHINKTNHATHSRIRRAVHEIYLSDPLDCLSQVVCGLNTYPPQVPSAKSSSANDYAYLLQHVILRLKKQPLNSTTISKPFLEEIEQLNDDVEQDDDNEGSSDSEEDDTTAERVKKKLLKNSKDQMGDIVELKGLYPPFGLIDYKRKRRAVSTNIKVSPKKLKKKFRGSNKKSKKSKRKKNAPPAITNNTIPKPLTLLQQLHREQDIREKLRSGAKCLYGILEHTCPFRYSELLYLMSGILERQKVISYSTNKILPMVGYLLKSRSLTQTLKSTFFALERVNNITIARHKNNEPISFGHIYEEIVRGDFAGNGLHIVETKNDATASFNVFEDDEFDAALANPFVPREKIPGYAIKNRSKKKNKDKSKESAKDEGDIIIPPPNAGPFTIGDIAGFQVQPQSQEDYDDNQSDDVEESIEDVPLPPVYGGFNEKPSHSKTTKRRRLQRHNH